MSEATLEAASEVESVVVPEVTEASDEPEKTREQIVKEAVDRLAENVRLAQRIADHLASPETVRVGYSTKFYGEAESIFADGCRLALTRLMDDIGGISDEIADLL